MKITTSGLATFGVLFLSCRFASPQGNELVIAFAKAAHVSGRVVTGYAKEPMENVHVVSFDCGTKSFRGQIEFVPVASTITDADGRFSLGWSRRTKVCVQFQSLGFNLLQIEVKRSKTGGELHPLLTPGT